MHEHRLTSICASGLTLVKYEVFTTAFHKLLHLHRAVVRHCVLSIARFILALQKHYILAKPKCVSCSLLVGEACFDVPIFFLQTLQHLSSHRLRPAIPKPCVLLSRRASPSSPTFRDLAGIHESHTCGQLK